MYKHTAVDFHWELFPFIQDKYDVASSQAKAAKYAATIWWHEMRLTFSWQDVSIELKNGRQYNNNDASSQIKACGARPKGYVDAPVTKHNKNH